MEYQDIEAEQIIEQHLQNVPATVREYIRSEAFPHVIRTLIGKHNLHIDTAYDVEVKTILLLVGLQQPNEYIESLKDIGLDEETARSIAADMNTQVFRPLMNSYRPQEKEQQNVPAQSSVEQPQPQQTSQSPMDPDSLYEIDSQNGASQPEPAPQTESAPRQFTNVFGGETAEQKATSVPSQSQTRETDLAPELPEPVSEPQSEETPSSQKPEKRYSVDPYREPID